MKMGSGTLEIKTQIKKKDGRVSEEKTEYEVKDGVVQDANIRR
jgi:hypothetical protein